MFIDTRSIRTIMGSGSWQTRARHRNVGEWVEIVVTPYDAHWQRTCDHKKSYDEQHVADKNI